MFSILKFLVVSPTLIAVAVLASSLVAEEGRSHALLVGCTRYPSLDQRKQLHGPANDVVLFRELLREKFHFPDDAIVTLAEHLNNDSLRPTRANIVREFERLIKDVKPSDQVVILLAGHGSQQPDNDADDDDDEPDGLDETFLPSDIGTWDKSKAVVKNAIVDDEIRGWLASIQNAGAFVFFVADSCHSGTLTRGNGSEVTRHVEPADLIPKEDLERARRTAAKRASRPGGSGRGTRIELPKSHSGIVALYAAQPDEEEPEMLLPRNSDQQKWFGLLTHTITEVLLQSNSPLTYRELSHQVHERYIQIGRLSYPTPMLEGTSLEREILGQKDWPDRAQYTVSRNAAGTLSLNAGSLHGLTKRSILAVFPPAGAIDAERSIGHVRIEHVRALEGSVVPCEFAGARMPESVPDGARAKVVYQDFGDLRLRVAVDGLDSHSQPISKERRELLSQVLKNLSRNEGSLIALEDDATQADWLVRSGVDNVFLVPASGFARSRSKAADKNTTSQSDVPSPLYGPGKIDETLPAWLTSQLQRIARVSNLKRIVGTSGARGESADDAIDIEVDVERVSKNGADPQKIAMTETGVRVVNEGDIVRLRVHNRGTVQVDVTLLVIDADFGITAVLPRAGTTDTNRIDPGKSLASLKLQITAASELEHVVAVAVRTEPQKPRMEFTCLAQDSLQRARGERGSDEALDSPLGKLLQNAMFAEGQTRGAPFAAMDRFALRRITWRVDPPRPEE